MFYNDWSEGDIEDVASSFDVHMSELEGVTIIHADYTYEDYSGSAYVLYEQNGKYYEVHGSHCSCMGLEGQWDPEECTLVELKEMLTRRRDDNVCNDLQRHLDATNVVL